MTKHNIPENTLLTVAARKLVTNHRISLKNITIKTECFQYINSLRGLTQQDMNNNCESELSRHKTYIDIELDGRALGLTRGSCLEAQQ